MRTSRHFFNYSSGNPNKRITANAERFGEGFAFRLNEEEFEDLKFQLGISKDRGGITKDPMMYMEHRAVMDATPLRSPKAVEASHINVNAFSAARRNEMARRQGQNLPAVTSVHETGPIQIAERRALADKRDTTLGRVPNVIAEPAVEILVRDEACEIAIQGLGAIKAHLKKQDITNEETLAEIQKLLCEAEEIDANIEARTIENNHRQLAYQAKQQRIVIEIQRYQDRGDADSLLAVFRDLGA